MLAPEGPLVPDSPVALEPGAVGAALPDVTAGTVADEAPGKEPMVELDPSVEKIAIALVLTLEPGPDVELEPPPTLPLAVGPSEAMDSEPDVTDAA